MSNIIDGRYISNNIIVKVKEETQRCLQYGVPGLAVIQIGDKIESSIYIKKKCRACTDIGFYSEVHNLAIDVTDDNVISLINDLNGNQKVSGILVQLPLPKHLDEAKILNQIAYDKDVDGFHVRNIGELALANREPAFVPCTPLGCLKILEHENIKIQGNHAVVIGKSNIVGLPMALLLFKRGCDSYGLSY